jgi:serine/threonine protein kinase
MADLYQFPKEFGQQDIVAWCTTGLVCLDAASKTVIKTPHDDDNCHRVQVEKTIYERFDQRGGHSGLLRYHGPYDSGIRLELAPNWNLSSFLRKHPEIEIEQRLRWARQATDALCFVHVANVVHGDLTLNIVFFTQDLDIKLEDFGGSSLDGSELLVSVHASHRYPGPLLSTDADNFFLGSALYTIKTAKLPYQDLSEEEITALFKEGKFPETDTFRPFGAIIRRSWQVKYKSAVEVFKDIEDMTIDTCVRMYSDSEQISAGASRLLQPAQQISSNYRSNLYYFQSGHPHLCFWLHFPPIVTFHLL